MLALGGVYDFPSTVSVEENSHKVRVNGIETVELNRSTIVNGTYSRTIIREKISKTDSNIISADYELYHCNGHIITIIKEKSANENVISQSKQYVKIS